MLLRCAGSEKAMATGDPPGVIYHTTDNVLSGAVGKPKTAFWEVRTGRPASDAAGCRSTTSQQWQLDGNVFAAPGVGVTDSAESTEALLVSLPLGWPRASEPLVVALSTVDKRRPLDQIYLLVYVGEHRRGGT